MSFIAKKFTSNKPTFRRHMSQPAPAFDHNRELLEAARDGDVSRVRLSLDQGVDVNVRNALGYTPLREAAVNDRFDVCRALVERGADIENVDDNGWTALHWAAAKGSFEVVRFLLRVRARIDAPNKEGSTPAHLAATKNHVDTLRLLVEEGADLEAKNTYGRNVLEQTEFRNSSNGSKSETVQYLRNIMRDRLCEADRKTIILSTQAAMIVASTESTEQDYRLIIEKLTEESKRLVRSKNDQILEISRMKGEVEYLKHKIDQSRVQIDELVTSVKKIEAEKRLKEDELQELAHAHDETINALRRELEMSTTNRLLLKGEVDRLATVRRDQSDDTTRLRDDRRRLSIENEKLENDLAQTRLEYEEALATIGKLEARFQMSLADSDGRLRELKRQMESQQVLLSRRLRDIETLNETKAQLDEQLKLRDVELSKSQVKCEVAIQELERERAKECDGNLRDEVSEKRKQIEQLKLTILQKSTSIAKLEERVGTLTLDCNEKRRIEEEKTALIKRLRSVEEECERLKRSGLSADQARLEWERQMSEILDVMNVPEDDLQITDINLGKGSFAEVKVARWRGTQVAVKIIYEILVSEHNMPLFEQEIRMCSRARHPHIVSICGVVTVNRKHPCLILELLEGSLTDVMQAAHLTTYLSTRETVDIARACLSGISYLHQLRPTILHGDIRPTNVLLSTLMEAKIGDLGASHVLNASFSIGPLSSEYLAPERSPNCQSSTESGTPPPLFARHNSIAADVYSLGVTLGELFSGCTAVKNMRSSQLQRIRHPILKDACIRLTFDEPGRRPEAREILETIEHVCDEEAYVECPPKRFVKGKKHGETEGVILTDKIW